MVQADRLLSQAVILQQPIYRILGQKNQTHTDYWSIFDLAALPLVLLILLLNPFLYFLNKI